MIELLMLATALLLVGLYVYITMQDTKRLKEIPMTTTKKLTEHNSWNLPAIDGRTGHTLVILNRHFNYSDMLPVRAGSALNDEALRRGYTYTLKGYEGKVFVKLRRSMQAFDQEPVEFGQSDPRNNIVPVEYTYAYVIEEINK